MNDAIAAGGCLCGAVRYEVAAEPLDSGYCHCSLCRRSTGAPVLVWVTFAPDAFRYTAGVPAVYASSAWGRREFCANCGTQICFRRLDEHAKVDVNAGSLDDPERWPPRRHIFSGDGLAWLDLDDGLPRHPGPPPGVG